MRKGLAHHPRGVYPAPAPAGKALVRGKNPQKLGYTSGVAAKTPQVRFGEGWSKLIVPIVLLAVLRAVPWSFGPIKRVARWFYDPAPTRRAAAVAAAGATDAPLLLGHSGSEPPSAQSLTERVTQSLQRSRATARRAEEAAEHSYSQGVARRSSDRRLPAPPLPAPNLLRRPLLLPVAEPSLPVAAEVTALTPIPDSIGNLYFIGLYRNTGEATITLPRVELSLWSADKRRLATATGYAVRHRLEKGETTPVKILVQHSPAYAEVTTELHPQPERYPQRRPKLALSQIQLERGRYSGYRVTGMVQNQDAAAARYVQIIALLYDPSEQIVGMDSHFLADSTLLPGQSSPFTVEVSQVRGRAARPQLDYQATEPLPTK